MGERAHAGGKNRLNPATTKPSRRSIGEVQLADKSFREPYRWANQHLHRSCCLARRHQRIQCYLLQRLPFHRHVNTFPQLRAYDPQFLFVGMTEQQKDINSINVMGSATSVLKTNKEGITFERAFMARFLLHLVGDIHQPLHSTCMYNQTFKTGDLGGIVLPILRK